MRSGVTGLILGLTLAVTLTFGAQVERVPCDRATTHWCKVEDFCIGSKNVCDGVNHCSDGSDERDCVFHCKGEHLFKCHSGDECISEFWKCDDDFDCTDRSDEKDCDPFKGKKDLGNGTHCKEDEFECRSGLCLPTVWRCDGQVDCADGSDESDETCSMARALDSHGRKRKCEEFKCHDGSCIPNRWVCDKSRDCPDGSDEGDICRHYEHPTACDTKNGWFLCSDNATCIHNSLMCDGTPNCHDKSDEGDHCAVDACKTAKCDHDCMNTAEGPRCFCRQGYTEISFGQCIDVDECKEYGKCSQVCTNTRGSYLCSCLPGYHMNEVTKECEAFNVPPILLYSTRTEIRGIEFRPNMTRKFQVGLTNEEAREAIGVGYDSVANRVYWTAVEDGREAIVSARLDGKSLETFKRMRVIMPEDLAVDYIARNIYFTESNKTMVGVCSIESKHCTVIIKEKVRKPRGISVLPEKGVLFYTDWGEYPMIMRAGMDGSDMTAIVYQNIVWPNGITVDKVTNRIFWADAKLNTLSSANFAGRDRRVVLDHISHPFSVAVFEDKLYWSDWQAREIQSCNKFTGKNLTVIVKEPRIAPMGITISHPLLENADARNPCARNFCSHICLIGLGGENSVCKCPMDHTLSPDSISCIAKPTVATTTVATTTTASTTTTTEEPMVEPDYNFTKVGGRLYHNKDLHFIKKTTTVPPPVNEEDDLASSVPVKSQSRFDTKGLIIGIVVLILICLIIGQCIYCCIVRRRQGKDDFSMHFRNIGLAASGGSTTSPRHQLPSSSDELKNVSVVTPGASSSTYSSFQNPTYSGAADSIQHNAEVDLYHKRRPDWQSSLDLESSASSGTDMKRSSTNPNLLGSDASPASLKPRSATMNSRTSGRSYGQSSDDLDEFDSISFGGDYSDKAQLIG